MKFKLLFAALLFSVQIQYATAATSGTPSMQVQEAEKLLWQGKLSESAKLFKSILKNAGDDAQSAGVYDNYAWLLQGQGKMADAVSYANRALEMRKKFLPPSAPEIAASYDHLGELNEAQGLQKEALDLYMSALQVSAGDPIPRSNIAEKIAIIQTKLGNRAAAEQYFREALEQKQQIGAASQRYSNPLASQTVLYRYAQGAPNSSRAAVAGESVASISAEGITVQAVVLPASDFKGLTAFVRVINQGHRAIDFLPEPPLMLVLKPRFAIAAQLSSDKVAADIEKKGNRKANLIRFFQGDATTTVSQQVYTSGTTVRNRWGYAPYPNGQWGAYPMPGTRWPQTTTIMTQVPDYEARARAEAKAQAATAKAADAAAVIRDQKLLATTLPPGEVAQGSVLFDATKVQEGVLRIPIGNAVFEFPFSE